MGICFRTATSQIAILGIDQNGPNDLGSDSDLSSGCYD